MKKSRYKKKVLTPLNHETFVLHWMKKENFKKESHRPFFTLLFWTGARLSEILFLDYTDIDLSGTEGTTVLNIRRLKGSTQTPPIVLDQELWGMPETWLYLSNCIIEHEKPFQFGRTTAYTIVKRAFPDMPNMYPHAFRMSRITNLLLEGTSIPEIKSFTGLTTPAIEHYVGRVDIDKIGEKLKREGKRERFT
jgi:integrase